MSTRNPVLGRPRNHRRLAFRRESPNFKIWSGIRTLPPDGGVVLYNLRVIAPVIRIRIVRLASTEYNQKTAAVDMCTAQFLLVIEAVDSPALFIVPGFVQARKFPCCEYLSQGQCASQLQFKEAASLGLCSFWKRKEVGSFAHRGYVREIATIAPFPLYPTHLGINSCYHYSICHSSFPLNV